MSLYFHSSNEMATKGENTSEAKVNQLNQLNQLTQGGAHYIKRGPRSPRYTTYPSCWCERQHKTYCSLGYLCILGHLFGPFAWAFLQTHYIKIFQPKEPKQSRKFITVPLPRWTMPRSLECQPYLIQNPFKFQIRQIRLIATQIMVICDAVLRLFLHKVVGWC